ncbi:hypothetical protein [Saccharicrinis sp. GN24d3]|uniref:hypothetical protein n=1 Tax=Saccharicrinis sp. GN24d3 TaxID=3458416 RepID=UPI00403530F4
MNTTIYYAPDAVGSLASIFTDGTYVYERVHQLGSLGALDGWLRRIGKKFKKRVRKIGKGIKKFAKGAVKVAKKVGKVTMKVVRKALPIVNTALTFIPGVGWAAKAVLTAAELGIKAYDKHKARKMAKAKANLKRKMAELNSKTTRLAKNANKVKPVQRVDKAPISQTINNQVKLRPIKPAAPQYSAMDFMRINAAVNRDKVKVDDVVNIVRNQVRQNY